LSLMRRFVVEGVLDSLLLRKLNGNPVPFKAYVIVLKALYGSVIESGTCPACKKATANIWRHFQCNKRCRSRIVHCTMLVVDELLMRCATTTLSRYVCKLCNQPFEHMWQIVDHIISQHPEEFREVVSSTGCGE